MISWQRRVRGLLAIGTAAFAAVLYLALGERPPRPDSPLAERRDPTALVESTGTKLVRLLDDTEHFQVEAGRQLLYPDGRARFEDGVRVRLPAPDRRETLLTARRGEVRDDRRVVDLDGDVRLTSFDGARVEADRATYDHRTGLVEVVGPMRFQQEGVVARGVGATYDRRQELLWIRERAAVEVRSEPSGEPTQITAATAVYARREHYWRFDGAATLVRAGLTGRAEQATVHLNEDARRIRAVELRGAARVEATGSSGLEQMTAQDITLDYGPDGAAPAQATLTGGAVVRLRGAAPEASRIAGEWMVVGFAPDHQVERLGARDRVDLQIPARDRRPARQIRARALDVTVPPGGGAGSARFSGSVEFRERSAATPNGEERIARADVLEATVASDLTDFREARFVGNVTIREGDVEARSEVAHYQTGGSIVRLEPSGSSGSHPRVTDGRVRIVAATIELALASRRLVADTDVRSEFFPARDPARRGEATRRRAVPLVRQDRPWYAAARRLLYDGQRGRAEFVGEVKLFQDETTIQAEQVVVDEAQGTLDAAGAVRSRVLVDHRDEETGTVERTATVGQADRLRYDEATKRLTYMDRAQLSGREGDVRAEVIHVYLRDPGDAIERMEAQGRVSVQLVARWATGDRLRYDDAEGRYVVVGTPVRIVEDLGRECRETRGRTLTFFRATDTINVDGNAENRTRTKTGGKCPALPLQ